MVTSAWFTAALGAVGLLLSADGAMAKKSAFTPPSYPTSRSNDFCPERCSVSGPNTGNWSVYSNFNPIRKCEQSMFYDFSLYDEVDNPAVNHRIHACSSFGPDFSDMPSSAAARIQAASATPAHVQFEVGWWEEGFGLATSGLRSLIWQIRKYIDNGHGATDRPFIVYGQSGQATIGLYIGQGLLNQGLSKSALRTFQDSLANLNVSTPSLAMQLCGPGYDSTHIFGVMATSNGTFAPIQNAIKTWANASCLSFAGSTSFPGQATFATPLLPMNGTANSTVRARALRPRAECRTVQVEPGDGCATLATKCGISGYDFTRYNPGSSFCSTLKPKQHACCTSGDLPDFRPTPNPDGSCHSYQVRSNDNCANLAAEYGLTVENLESFNKNTWGWNGCKLLFLDAVMCLSKGTPPFPAPIGNAVCGPQKRGSKPPTDGSNIADMNPCPIKACCNIWGQCGFSKDFCIDTNTGAPGTAAPGTYGCISNCGGLDIKKGDGTGAIKIGYFQGYNLGRECLYQDVHQIDTSRYTHIHFAFGTLTPSFEVEVGDVLSTYQFNEFKRIKGVKRILSFGGWDFSNNPQTYTIFRNGVLPANRLTMATNIANFIKKHDLDGVDIDWEYPGAPDLPVSDPGKPEEGINYLFFLVTLKNLLPGRTVSIAAPSSYWYLKQYPIETMGAILDYIVFMTYDLHGQWDANNQWSQEGCPTGNCLRSQVNLTETRQSLAMITKAGVPGRKVVVGVTSYGRSFEMAQPGCWGADCHFTGDELNSNAKKGRCTGTAGYIADAEIAEIMAGSSDRVVARSSDRVVASFVDQSSHTDVLVYDNNQWVGYMSSRTKQSRESLYRNWGMGGFTDWATDLQAFNEPPPPSDNWATVIELARSGLDPRTDHTRTGNWTGLQCTNKYTVRKTDHTPTDRWRGVYSDEAWKDVVRVWKEYDRDRKDRPITFMESVSTTLHMGSQARCGSIKSCGCDNYAGCEKGADGDFSGPASEFIWNSLVAIHRMHHDFHTTLFQAAATISFSLDDMENTFAPIPEPPHDWRTNLMINLITLGTLSVGGPFFNNIIKRGAFFSQGTLNNVKDTSLTVVGQTTTTAKDLFASWKSGWNDEGQDSFSHDLGKAIDIWGQATELALSDLFNGTDKALEILEEVMADGKLIEGMRIGEQLPERDPEVGVVSNLRKTIFTYSIPVLWRASKNYVFVLNTGSACGATVSEYVEEDTREATGACVDGIQYYMVHPPEGPAEEYKCRKANQWGGCDLGEDVKTPFAAPPGIGSLGKYDITKEELIRGSVRTWIKNGRMNKGNSALPDPAKRETMDDLIDEDMTLPGFVRLPVCSPERAWQTWDTAGRGSSENYPCDMPPGISHCGESTFVDQTSDASPNADDCFGIIRTIEPDGSTDWTTAIIAGHREISDHGTCHFGVEVVSANHNADFRVGGGDVKDIIIDAVAKFRRSNGKIGAKGEMQCNGNLPGNGVRVKWGIY